MAGPIDKTRFGTGYISDMEKADIFVFAGTEHFDDKEGAGGAVPVRGYTGPWPTFGKPEDSWEQQGDVGWSSGEGSSSSSSSSLSSSDKPVRRPRWMCKSTGRCSSCPPNELHRPYCQPYGNRAPIECRPVTVLPAAKKPETHENAAPLPPAAAAAPDGGKLGKAIEGKGTEEDSIPNARQLWLRQETVVGSDIYKGYQVCGRDHAKETWDFAEFVAFNLVFALVGLLVLLNRQRFLAGQHQSMLARRIGRM